MTALAEIQPDTPTETHAKTWIDIDLDGVAINPEGKEGYLRAWLGALATDLSEHLTVEEQNPLFLEKLWYSNRDTMRAALAHKDIKASYGALNELWQANEASEKKTPYDPISYFQKRLTIPSVDFTKWLQKIETTPRPNGKRLAENHMLPGADKLWEHLLRVKTTQPEKRKAAS